MILADDADRLAYLELLRQYSELYRLSLLGYCLMSNHVHLIVVPRTPGLGRLGAGPDLRGMHNHETGCPTLREVRSVGIPTVGIKRLS